MGDDLAVGLGGKLGTLSFQLAAQLAEVLDDAVMHHGEPIGRVRMRVVLGRASVRRPAGVTDADRAGKRLTRELCFQILELAFGTPPRQRTFLQCRYASRIVTAVFEALERIDQLWRDRLVSNYSDNAAHLLLCPPKPRRRARSQTIGITASKVLVDLSSCEITLLCLKFVTFSRGLPA
jgi:hypothetical protein